MLDRSQIATFTSFEEADDAEREARWRMSREERIEILEALRRYQYPDGKSAPRLQRLFESVGPPQG